MNLAEHSLRVATLSAVADYFTRQAKAARDEAEAAYKSNGVKKIAIALPDGEEVGEITVIQPGPAVFVHEDDLLAWVEKHTPTEIEEYLDVAALTDQEAVEWAREHRDDLLKRRIRRVWRDELQKMIAESGGYVADQATGDSQKVADVTKVKPTGAFALSPDKQKARADRLIAALVAGELNGIIGDLPVLAIPSGARGE